MMKIKIFRLYFDSGEDRMILISYGDVVLWISTLWLLLRAFFAMKKRGVTWKREAQLLLIYVCLIVAARFTFFPFATLNGQIQPLTFDPATAFPFRINLLPFYYLLNYPSPLDAAINVLGNTLMFVPFGLIWPWAFPQLNSAKRTLLAGFGISLAIELLQLPFYERVSDIDDLILNTLGFAIGYWIYRLLLRKKA